MRERSHRLLHWGHCYRRPCSRRLFYRLWAHRSIIAARLRFVPVEAEVPGWLPPLGGLGLAAGLHLSSLDLRA